MKNKNISLPISFSVNNEISDKNNRFINVTIDVLHTGLNYNGSIFNKEVVNENIDTIKNTPILGFITEVPYDDKDFKGHEYVITRDKDGVKRKYIGEAFGLIPESCNPRWITKTTDSGAVREFLQVDGILWSKFQDAADIMLNDIEKPQSMELYPYDIDGYDNDDGDFVFTKFSFDGCCILGSTVEPAMENAKIEVQFSLSDFVRSIQNELNDKYNTFTKMVNEETNQGGIKDMPNTDFTQTLLAQFEDISAMVRQHETYTDKWGYECFRYYAVDIQENEVIVVDTLNGYNYFGLSFAMNGDKAEINFESAKRKKLRYEDYVEGSSIENAFDFGKHIAEIQDTAFAKVEEANTKVSEAETKVSEFEVKVSEAETKVSEFEVKVSEFETAKNEIEEKYNQISAEFEEMKPKYEDYVKAEQARIEAELEAQKDAEFAKYEAVLTDDVNFEALKEKKAEMTVKEIESECAILYARKNLAQANFSKSDDVIMTAGLINNTNREGFVETKWGYIPVRHN